MKSGRVAWSKRVAAAACALAMGGMRVFAGPAEIGLPTANRALFEGRPEDFYQFVDREIDGVKSTPWEAGAYGFVRDQRIAQGRTVFRRFHEGVDIKPVERDAKGIPRDAVNAIADGVVAYVSLLPGASNYGRYVVVEHRWEGCSYLSLYAHLAEIDVKPGEPVAIGQRLGLLGWSGDGIDLRRAHVHLELNLFLHSEFVAWHDKHFRSDGPAKNVFNGLNLAGIDVAEFFLRRQKDPGLTIVEFIQSQPVAYRVAVPGDARLELKGRYPWMLAKEGAGPSWEISFTASGLPVRIAKYEREVAAPVLTWVKPVDVPLAWATKDFLTDSGSGARLTEAGLRMLDLIAPASSLAPAAAQR